MSKQKSFWWTIRMNDLAAENWAPLFLLSTFFFEPSAFSPISIKCVSSLRIRSIGTFSTSGFAVACGMRVESRKQKLTKISSPIMIGHIFLARCRRHGIQYLGFLIKERVHIVWNWMGREKRHASIPWYSKRKKIPWTRTGRDVSSLHFRKNIHQWCSKQFN